jgi:hypothetical protein
MIGSATIQQGRPGVEAETVSAASTHTRLDSLELLERGHQLAQDFDQALVIEGRRVEPHSLGSPEGLLDRCSAGLPKLDLGRPPVSQLVGRAAEAILEGAQGVRHRPNRDAAGGGNRRNQVVLGGLDLSQDPAEPFVDTGSLPEHGADRTGR